MISVIIPLYNKRATIRRTVESVLNQPYDDIEVIVIDDGSTDASVSSIADIQDSRLIIVQKVNEGVSSARNRGIEVAKGDWLYFIDADDYISAKSGFNIFNEGFKTDADIIVANFKCFSENGASLYCEKMPGSRFVSNPFKMHYLHRCFLQAGSFVVKRHIAIKKLFNIQLRRYEDTEAYLRWVADARVYCVDDHIFTSDRRYSNLAIPNPNYWNGDYAFHLTLSHSLWRNLCQASILQEAVIAYPEQRKLLWQKYGLKGAWYLLLNRIVRKLQPLI